MTEEERRLAKIIGVAISNRRRLSGFTQDEVAERLNLGKQAISRIERGTVIPTVARLIRFAEVFSCPVDALLVESSNRSDDQGKLLSEMISTLSEAERGAVVEIVRKISDVFGKGKTA